MLQKMYYWSIEDMKGVIRNRRIQNIMDKNTENKQLSTRHDTANYDCATRTPMKNRGELRCF